MLNSVCNVFENALGSIIHLNVTHGDKPDASVFVCAGIMGQGQASRGKMLKVTALDVHFAGSAVSHRGTVWGRLPGSDTKTGLNAR
jgi:hypothetical protein